MSFPKILAAGALASTFAFAQEGAWPADEQTDASTSSATEAEEAEQPSEAAEPQEKVTNSNVSVQVNNQVTNNNNIIIQVNNQQTNQVAIQNNYDSGDNAYADNTADAPKKASSLNSNMGVGIHGDFNYSYLIGLPQDWYLGDDADAPSGIGFDVGFRGRIPMASILQFAPEINFHYAQLAMDEEGCDHKFKQMDLEVPVMMRAIIKDRFYVAAGVQLSLSLSNEVSFEQEDIKLGDGLGTLKEYKYEEDINQAGFGFGIAFGIGGFVMERLSIDAGLVLGLTDTYPDISHENGKNVLFESMDGGKQMTFKVGAGFWFL